MLNFDFNSCFKCYEKYQLGFFILLTFFFFLNFAFFNQVKNPKEKPFKCCNLTLNDLLNENEKKFELNKNLIECRTCLQWVHFDCINLQCNSQILTQTKTEFLSQLILLILKAEDLELLKQNFLKLECQFCDSSLTELKNQLYQLKLKSNL